MASTRGSRRGPRRRPRGAPARSRRRPAGWPASPARPRRRRPRPPRSPRCWPSSPSYAVVSSPKYQTLPAVSWAYQSKVSSTTVPAASVATSWTTVVVTPATDLGPVGDGDRDRSRRPSRRAGRVGPDRAGRQREPRVVERVDEVARGRARGRDDEPVDPGRVDCRGRRRRSPPARRGRARTAAAAQRPQAPSHAPAWRTAERR